MGYYVRMLYPHRTGRDATLTPVHRDGVTSAGALGAAMLAAYGPDKLVKLWRSMTNKQVLGVRRQKGKLRNGRAWLWSWLTGHAFSLYSSDRLRALIGANVTFDALTDKHLIVALTSYTSGRLHAFYQSSLVADFVKFDESKPAEKRRLGHFVPIQPSRLADVLLASSSIPYFFPPVLIGDEWYVDGGVGNNTPIREAALFMRYLRDTKSGIPGDTYCIRLDPPRLLVEGPHDFGTLDVIKRTIDIFHHVITDGVVEDWGQINRSVAEHERNVASALDDIRKMGLGDEPTRNICCRVGALAELGSATRRLELPLVQIQPSSVIGDTLEFAPDAIAASIKRGHADVLKTLKDTGRLSDVDFDALNGQPVFAD